MGDASGEGCVSRPRSKKLYDHSHRYQRIRGMSAVLLSACVDILLNNFEEFELIVVVDVDEKPLREACHCCRSTALSAQSYGGISFLKYPVR